MGQVVVGGATVWPQWHARVMERLMVWLPASGRMVVVMVLLLLLPDIPRHTLHRCDTRGRWQDGICDGPAAASTGRHLSHLSHLSQL